MRRPVVSKYRRQVSMSKSTPTARFTGISCERVCGVTDIGCQRKDNQDSYAIRHLDGGAVLLVVCDGMGGAQAGSVASAVAVEEFTSAVEEGLGQGSLDDPSRWEAP